MQTIDANAILLALMGLVFIYLVAAMITVDGWVLYRLLTGRPVLPPSSLVHRQPIPWGVWTVLLLFLLNLVLPQCVFIGYAMQNGLLRKRTPVAIERVSALAGKQPPQDRPPAPETKSSDTKSAPENSRPREKSSPSQTQPKDHPAKPSDEHNSSSGMRLSLTELLALQAVSSVALLVVAVLVLRVRTRSPLRDLGLSFNRWWLQVAVGLIAFLAIQPALMATQAAMTRIWENRQHPLLKMVTDEFSPGVPQLAILLAVIVAPIAEELIFRGVIQSWLVDRAASALNGMSSSISSGVTQSPSVSPSQPFPPRPSPTRPRMSLPRPGHPSCHPKRSTRALSRQYPRETSRHRSMYPRSPTSPRRRTLASTVAPPLSWVSPSPHSSSPPSTSTNGRHRFALFLLAVAIGYVYERTGSLIAAICMHAAFNGLSTFLLLSSLLVPQSAQHPELPRIKKTAAVSDNSKARDCACIHSGKQQTTG